MKVVMPLYFRNALKWDEDFSTIVYHIWIMCCYFTPLFGAILADSLLGKFRTIFYLSIVYCCGCVILSLAATPLLNMQTGIFSVLGLAFIFLGAGGIKPCVSAFGGDQFKIPGQESQLASYFAVFYFSLNSGSLISQMVTPIFREDVSCFGDKNCYSLAFGVPAALMILALVVYLLGRPKYKRVEPKGNIVLKVLKAVKHSFLRRGNEIKIGSKREHWLDYADDKFDQRFLDEAKVVFKILFLYLPLPVFWTLFSQQGSRWTFQANRMDNRIAGIKIKPDQMQVLNPILVLLLIPVFDRIIYPVLGKCGLLKKPLQRLSFGLVFSGLSFVVSGIVELFLVSAYSVELAKGESSLHIINTLPCAVTVTGINDKGLNHKDIMPNEMLLYKSIATNNYQVAFNRKLKNECQDVYFDNIQSYTINLVSGNATTFIIFQKLITHEAHIMESKVPDALTKSENGDSKLRIMYLGFGNVTNITFTLDGAKQSYKIIPTLNGSETTDFKVLEPSKYRMSVVHSEAVQGVSLGTELEMKPGRNYIVSIVYSGRGEKYQVGFHEITTPNSIHILWLIPQFVIMAIGEIMFSVTIMDFSYNEAPPSMKSVMQSAWMMTVAFGNLIVVIIAKAKIFQEQCFLWIILIKWKEFFLFAGIMMVDILIFSYLAYLYKPTDKFWQRSADEKDEGEKNRVKTKGENNVAFDTSE